MSNASSGKISMPQGIQSAINKTGENIGEQAVNWITAKLREKYGQALVLTGSIYTRYLENAYTRYNKVKTLVTGLEPRSIIGQNSLYIQVDVKHKKKVYNTSTVNPLLAISKNILICGSGGAGKSMLMRYLFLNTVNRGEYIPVLLELRKIAEPSNSDNVFFHAIFRYEKRRIVDPDSDTEKGFLVNQLDSVDWLTETDRNLLIQYLIRGFQITHLVEEINRILDSIDDMRNRAQISNNLLDYL